MNAKKKSISVSKAQPKGIRLAPVKPLLADVRTLILEARQRVAQTVNAGLTILYWQIGTRIRKDILKEKRAEYGEEIVHALSGQLTAEFGKGFGRTNLFNMVRFAEVFPDLRIVQSLIAKLGWTHFRQIIYLDDPLKRDFYAEMCRLENWNTRTLARKIQSMLFERTALSKKPDKLIRQELDALQAEDKLTPDLVFRDPYVLDFLGLQDTYAEKDLEAAILREIGDFQAADKGQMELYLAWLKRFECEPDDEPPIGLILCAGKKEQHVELLEPGKSGIHVASYWTKALPKAELEQKLRDAVRLARARLENLA